MIMYPADAITIGQMRRIEPDLFAANALGGYAGGAEALSLHCWEQVIAEKAFAVACSLADPFPEAERGEIVAIIDHGYQSYGISSGARQSLELVRDIERSAASQARTPPSRRR